MNSVMDEVDRFNLANVFEIWAHFLLEIVDKLRNKNGDYSAQQGLIDAFLGPKAMQEAAMAEDP